MAETDRGDEGTGENVGESVPGDNMFMSKARAEANERVLLIFVVSLILSFGVSTIGSADDWVSVRGGEGGWSSMGGKRTCG